MTKQFLYKEMAGCWEKRFMWLANQHWVEGESSDNLNITYQDGDEYIHNLISAIDAEIAADQP